MLDDEAVKIINTMSNCIKEFIKNTKQTIKQVASNTEAAGEQIISTKGTITDLHIQVTTSLLQSSTNKYSQKQMITQNKEKLLKEKLNATLEQLESLNLLKNNISKNIRYTETYCYKFYEEAKGVFKKLKNLHSEKLSELDDEFKKSRAESNNGEIRHNKAKSVDPIKRGRNSEEKIQRKSFLVENVADSYDLGYTLKNANIKVFSSAKKLQTKNKSDFTGKVNVSMDEKNFLSKLEDVNIKNQVLTDEINKIHETYIQTNSENMRLRQEIEVLQRNNKTIISDHLHGSTCSSASKLAELTVLFIKKMANLQEAINKKQNDVKELKQDFEVRKKELILFANDILKNSKIEEDNELVEQLRNELDVLTQEREQLLNEIKMLNEKVISNLNLNKRYDEENKKLIKDINTFKSVNESLTDETKVLKVEVSNLQEELGKLKNNTTKIDEFNKLKTLNNNLENLVKNLGEDIEKKNLIINSLNKKRTEASSNDISELKKKSEELRNAYIKYEEANKNLEKMKDEYKNIHKQVEVKDIILNEIIQQLKRLENNKFDILEGLDIQDDDEDAIVSHVQSVITTFMERLISLRDNFDKKEVEINELRLKTTKNKNESFINELIEKNKHIANLESELSEFKDQYNELESREGELKLKLQKYTAKESNENNLNLKHASLTKELNETIQRMNLSEEHVGELENELNEKNQKLISLSNDLDLANRKITKLTENETKLKSLEQENLNSKGLQKELEEMITKNNLLEEQLEEHVSDVNEKEKKINSLSKEITELNKKLNKLTKDEGGIKEQHTNELNELKELVKEKEDFIEVYERDIMETQKKLKTLENKLKVFEEGDKSTKSKDLSELKESRLKIIELTEINRGLADQLSDLEQKLELNDVLMSEMKKTGTLISERKNTEVLKREEKIKQLEERIKEQLNTIINLEDKIDAFENQVQDSPDPKIYEEKMKSFEDKIKKEKERCEAVIQKYEEKIKVFEDKTKISEEQVLEYEDKIQDLKDIAHTFETKVQNYENKIGDMKSQHNNNMENKNNEIKKLNQKIFALEDIIAKNENEINELKNNELEMLDYRNRSSSDEKIKTLNLQMTNKINQLSAENTNLKDEKERLSLVESNFNFVCLQINQFFERMVSVIQKLKTNTNTILPDEIEKRISELESENEEYNLEFLDKDLEFAFLVIADIFEKYEELSKSETEIVSRPNIDAVLKKKDIKIIKYKEELKKMKNLFDDCTQTIYEGIKVSAPNFVDEELLINLGLGGDNISNNSSLLTANNNCEMDFIHKAVEMFKTYNQEINDSNKALEKQLAESETNARRLKNLADEYKSNLDMLLSGKDIIPKSPKQTIIDVTKGRSFTVEDLLGISEPEDKADESEDYVLDYTFIQKAPQKYKIVQEALYKDFKWFLVISKQLDNNVYDVRNITWVPQDSLLAIDMDKEIDPDDEQFNEEDVTELINKNFDLENELKDKADELKGYKDTIDKLLKNQADISISKGTKTIPLEKYEMVLQDLHEEQLRGDELTKHYDELKKTFECYKNTIGELQRKAVNKSFNTKEHNTKEPGDINVHDLLEAHNNNAFNKFDKANKTSDSINIKKGGLGLINPLDSSYHHNYTLNDSPRMKTHHSGSSIVYNFLHSLLLI
jgi:chromosome segregation ATPase